MARSKKDENVEETFEGEIVSNDNTETMDAPGTEDAESEAMELSEDDFVEVLWPANKPLHVYIQRPRVGTVKNEDSKAYGRQYVSCELVMQDAQDEEDLEAFAGQPFDFMLMKEQRNMKLLKQLLMAAFGEIRSYTAEELENVPLIVTMRHGQRKKDDSGEMVIPMYVKTIRRDPNYEIE